MDTEPVILLLLGRGLLVSEAEQRQEPDVSLEFVPEPFLVDTPLGRGYALMVETDHFDNWWTVVLLESRALMTYPQKELRVARSYTIGLGLTTEEMKKILGSKDV